MIVMTVFTLLVQFTGMYYSICYDSSFALWLNKLILSLHIRLHELHLLRVVILHSSKAVFTFVISAVL